MRGDDHDGVGTVGRASAAAAPEEPAAGELDQDIDDGIYGADRDAFDAERSDYLGEPFGDGGDLGTPFEDGFGAPFADSDACNDGVSHHSLVDERGMEQMGGEEEEGSAALPAAFCVYNHQGRTLAEELIRLGEVKPYMRQTYIKALPRMAPAVSSATSCSAILMKVATSEKSFAHIKIIKQRSLQQQGQS